MVIYFASVAIFIDVLPIAMQVLPKMKAELSFMQLFVDNFMEVAIAT